MLGVFVYVSVQISEVRSALVKYESQPVKIIERVTPEVVHGKDGVSITGPKGDTGEKGDKGDTAQVDYSQVDSRIDQKVTAMFSTLPIPKDGEIGPAGREIELCKLLDGTLGQRYVGTLMCNPIEVAE